MDRTNKKYQLALTTPLVTFRTAIVQLNEGLIRTPADLSGVATNQALALDQEREGQAAIVILWKSSKIHID